MALDRWAGDDFLTAGSGITITEPDTTTGGATIAATPLTGRAGESAAYRVPDGGNPPDTEGEDRADATVGTTSEEVLGTVTVNVPMGDHVMVVAFSSAEGSGPDYIMLRIYKGTTSGTMISYSMLVPSSNVSPVTLLAVDTDPAASQQYTFSVQTNADGVVMQSPIMSAVTFTPSGGVGESALHSPQAFQAFP